jgi:hypothetical protein
MTVVRISEEQREALEDLQWTTLMVDGKEDSIEFVQEIIESYDEGGLTIPELFDEMRAERAYMQEMGIRAVTSNGST